jgi:hypothetical protein
MNPNGTFERDLERWLEAEAPTTGPAGLHDSVIERARTMRQRPSWMVSLRGGTLPSPAWVIGRPARRLAYVLVVLGLIVALIVGAIAAGALRSHPVRPPGWTATGAMLEARDGHTATLLPDGKVLVAGGQARVNVPLASAELYDPASGSWTATGNMVTPRYAGHTATLLPDGKVLVVGGYNNGEILASAELYDPASGSWTATGNMVTPRNPGQTATLLPDGRVLVAGGNSSTGLPLASAELYDPASGTWTATGYMKEGRYGHTATLLPDGKVLVAGGVGAVDNGYGLASAELYDPASGSWTATGNLKGVSGGHTATLLRDGKVLAVGGPTWVGSPFGAADLYDPTTGSWTATGNTKGILDAHTATLLPDGKVLVAGDIGTSDLAQGAAELYDPASGSWTATPSMPTRRFRGYSGEPGTQASYTATLLGDGKVLVAGGPNDGPNADPQNADAQLALASAELYDPGSGN